MKELLNNTVLALLFALIAIGVGLLMFLNTDDLTARELGGFLMLAGGGVSFVCLIVFGINFQILDFDRLDKLKEFEDKTFIQFRENDKFITALRKIVTRKLIPLEEIEAEMKKLQ